MFILGNFLQTVALILDRLLWIYNYVVMIAVLMSWVSPDPSNPIVRFLRTATEPVFDWVRRHLPFTVVGMFDLSPFAVFFSIWFLRMFAIKSLMDVALRLR